MPVQQQATTQQHQAQRSRLWDFWHSEGVGSHHVGIADEFGIEGAVVSCVVQNDARGRSEQSGRIAADDVE